ncbi:MAG TPA: hypothetical protein VKQ89_01530 [Candidatus Angelobacter sp.]|nr:hypothetical protein [Candidatus Angelobacter sp.]
MSKRGLIILVLFVLFGVYFFVVGYEFLEKENALFQKRVKAAKEEQRRCEARLSKFRNFDQFRTSIRLPYASDLPLERWTQQYNTLRAGMSESEVEIIMGAPDYVECGLSKKGDQFLGSTWKYEVAVPADLAASGQNSEIDVSFEPDGKVKDKSAMNLQPKPSPTPSPTPAATVMPSSTPSPSATATPAASPTATPAASASPAPSATPETTPH